MTNNNKTTTRAKRTACADCGRRLKANNRTNDLGVPMCYACQLMNETVRKHETDHTDTNGVDCVHCTTEMILGLRPRR